MNIAWNPQVLTDDFVVSSSLIEVGFGATSEVIENNPNRVAMVISTYGSQCVLNISPPSSQNDGWQMISGQGPTFFIYQDVGAMVGYNWYAFNFGGFGVSYVSIIETSYRPNR